MKKNHPEIENKEKLKPRKEKICSGNERTERRESSMSICQGIETVDVHGCNREEASWKVYRALKKCDKSVYWLKVIHGYNGGTVLRDTIRKEYSKGRNHVLRVEEGPNPGITILVLRELCA